MMKIKSIKIGDKTIGEGYDSYIIAEIGSNFNGRLSTAKKLIRLAKESGADAAKFQSFLTEKLLSKKGFEKKLAFQSKWKKSTWDIYKEAELPRKWNKQLSEYAKKIGIHFFASPWDFDAVDILDELDIPAFKIGSGDITYHKILKYIASKKKPILLATGGSNLKEVTDAINVIKSTGNNKIILMHSVMQYPSPIDEANLNAMVLLRNKFRMNVGYSDHSLGSLVVLGSISLGAKVIEKHFTLNPKSIGPDHPHSLNPLSFKNMVTKIHFLEKAMGDGIKKSAKSERETIIIQRRGVWTTKKILKGEKFTEENIKALRPVVGISASKYDVLIGKSSKKNYKAFEPIINN